MKKRIWHLSRCVVVCTAFLFVQQFIQSQVSNPSTWESFVQSNANISIRDTFRMQTFEGLASDNWDYAITGEALIEDISGVKDIPNSHGNYGLRMPMNTQVAFEHFTLTNHQDIKISIRKGGHPSSRRRRHESQNLSKRGNKLSLLSSNHRREWHQSFQNHRYKKQSSGLRSYRPHTGRQYQKRLLLCRQRLRTRHDSYLFPIYRKQRLEP